MAVHLTFDDGPDPTWTPAVLHALEDAGARATFFVLGPAAERRPDLIERMVAEGHEVALHADSHVRHSELDEAAVSADATAALSRLEALGVLPQSWRTPWGVVTPATRSTAAALGLVLRGWSLDSQDWRGDTTAAMLARIGPELEDGDVVLMHDGLGPGARRGGCAATVELTRALCSEARRRGLEATPLAQAGTPA